ncbi:biotin/lipoyl-binding carrier protein [Aeromicrobium halocynthiae]|uniref:Biotin/lipoyl-binding carrier protein n=1 Tax=Aeromicrobium halocynthiae TaxID=560557 RepID=A0ABN2VW96_9ACTN
MSKTLHTELAASVFKIHVSPGDRLDAGDTVATLESMKMEIPIVAEVACRIDEILVEEGDIVDEGDAVARWSGC